MWVCVWECVCVCVCVCVRVCVCVCVWERERLTWFVYVLCAWKSICSGCSSFLRALIYLCVCVCVSVVKASKPGHETHLSSFEVCYYFPKPSGLWFPNKSHRFRLKERCKSRDQNTTKNWGWRIFFHQGPDVTTQNTRATKDVRYWQKMVSWYLGDFFLITIIKQDNAECVLCWYLGWFKPVMSK